MNDDAKLILRLEARTTKYQKDLKKAIDKLEGNVKRGNKSWNKGMTLMERRTKRFTSNVKGQFAALGTIGVGAFLTISTRTIADFRQSMSTVQAVTKATTTEFALLEEKARALGATTRFSASEAAEGMVSLGRAGLDTNKVLSTIEGTLLLAQSGALELGEASKITAGTMNGFRLEADQAGRVVDVLSLAANSSATDVSDLGQAMSFVSSISATLGISLEETTAAVSTLSDNQIGGTRAGAGLRKILIDLAASGKDFSAEAGGLGGVVKDLAKEFDGLSKIEKLGKAADLVGKKQAAALLILLNNTDKLGDLKTAYEGAAGSAEKAARIMDNNLNGALLATKSRAQELQIALGEAGGEQALLDGLESLQDALTFVAENAGTFQKALIVLAAASAGLIGGAALGGVIKSLGVARTAFLTKAAAANVATLSLKGLTLGVKQLLLALGPAGWVAIAVGAIAAFTQFGGAADKAAQNIDNFDSTMGKLAKSNEQLKTDSKQLKGLMEELAEASLETGSAAQSAKVMEIGALNARIAKNKELGETYKTLLRAQITAGQAAANDLEKQQLKLTRVRTHRPSSSPSTLGLNGSERVVSRQDERRLKQEGFNKLLEEANEAAARGEALTKKQTKALELHVEQAEALAKVVTAQQQIADLDAPVVAAPPAGDDDDDDAGGGGGGSSGDADEKALESKLEAIAKLGQTEREQIAELLAARLASIAKSTKAEEVKAELRAKAHADAKSEIADLLLAENEAIAKAASEKLAAQREAFDLHNEELGYLAQIEAAQSRAAGNALEATRIELDAIRERYEAEIDFIKQLIAEKGATQELEVELAAATAGLENIREERLAFERETLEQIDAITNDSSRLESALEAINLAEQAKLDRLADYYGQREALTQEHQDRVTAIEEEADRERLETRLKSYEDNLSSLQGALTGFSSALAAAGKEDSKAAKIAAKAQQVVAIGQAAVNTAQGVTKALALGPIGIPIAVAVGALGAAQIAVMASQTFDGGGFTGHGARAGGLDGKGGFMAMLHPNETVVDHTRPNAPIAGQTLEQGLGIQTAESLPRGVNPRSVAGANAPAASHSFTSGDLIVQGNVDKDTLPKLKEQMDMFVANQNKKFNEMSDKRDKKTQPRTNRRVGRGRR